MKYFNAVAVISGEIMYQTLLAANLIRGRNITRMRIWEQW